jgi:hypothetical protein
MPGNVTVFDFTQVLASFGPIAIQGFADGDAISVEYNGDRETKVVGADGNVVRVVSANKAATVTLRLQRGSPTAAAFRAWKKTTIKPLDQQPFRIRDIAAGIVHQSLIAWIGPEPAPSFSPDAPVEEWTIECAAFDSGQLIAPIG